MIGWMTDTAEANTYFIEKRLEVAAWDAMVTATKTKALWNGYNRICRCSDFSIPATPSAAELLKLKDAQCEMAYYLAIHLADEDRRKGLTAQGVVGAGIVKETYDKDSLDKLPIPPIVLEILMDFYKYGEAMAMIPIDRDEDKDMATDVVEED